MSSVAVELCSLYSGCADGQVGTPYQDYCRWYCEDPSGLVEDAGVGKGSSNCIVGQLVGGRTGDQ